MVTPRYLLDTNVAIDLLRGLPKLDQARFVAAEGVIAVCTITVMELEYGIERSSRPDVNRAEVVALLSRLVILGFNHSIGARKGEWRKGTTQVDWTSGPNLLVLSSTSGPDPLVDMLEIHRITRFPSNLWITFEGFGQH